ncbi:hypothetical protein AMTR_s00003p00270840 [Amborella trichopoda]|uniref:Uncharacterized protein n=1 Tax=Amborella trichopoda TaxID=13333 RepID=W1P107_AMBTC|nr:hypothetical protein AMTR_s00003p00270840 [Amborella trichopoda]
MSQTSRVWMAAGVAVTQSQTDQGFKWNSGLKRVSASSSGLLRRFSGGSGPVSGALFIPGGGREEKLKQAEESLQKGNGRLICGGQVVWGGGLKSPGCSLRQDGCFGCESTRAGGGGRWHGRVH